MKDRMWTDGGISRYNICYACKKIANSGSGKGRSVSKATKPSGEIQAERYM
jgi:hypothetical protein